MIDCLYPAFCHWSEGGSVWIISDPHLGDADCKLIDAEWPAPQDYIDNLKGQIFKNDTLICLGDVGDPSYFAQLNCYKVLIKGNHDKGSTNYQRKYIVTSYDYGHSDYYLEKVINDQRIYSNRLFNEVYEGPLFIAPKILLSHEPIEIPFGLNIHGHLHDGTYMKWDENSMRLNVTANVMGYQPVNLKDIITLGYMADTKTIHEVCIAEAREREK